ncbi:MAG: hypothetical protein QM770_01460 [Tepidisphaeraceae bacterium]
MRLPKIPNWLIRIAFGLGAAFMVWGWLLGFFSFEIARWVGRNQSDQTEFPLFSVDDVTTDERGQMYVANGFYQRVQRYSATGQFERGWNIPAAGGMFRFTIANAGIVQVVTARTDQRLTYNVDGELVHSEPLLTTFQMPSGTDHELHATGWVLVDIVDKSGNVRVRSSRWMQLLAWNMSFVYVASGLSFMVVAAIAHKHSPSSRSA